MLISLKQDLERFTQMVKPWAQRQDLSHIWAWLQHPATSQISVWEFTFQKTWPLLHIVKSAQNTPPIFIKKHREYSSDILGDYSRANVMCSCSYYMIDQICAEHWPWSDKSNVPTCKSRNSHNSILKMKRGRRPSFNMTSPMADAWWPMTSPMLQWQVQCHNKQVQTHS